jgi:hypothetical protein
MKHPRTNRRRAAKSKSPKPRPPGTMPVTDFVYGAKGKRRSAAKYAEPALLKTPPRRRGQAPRRASPWRGFQQSKISGGFGHQLPTRRNQVPVPRLDRMSERKVPLPAGAGTRP